MSSKVLITGIAGFVGSHLGQYLHSLPIENLAIHGIVQHTHSSLHLNNIPGLVYHPLELEDTTRLTRLLEEIQPDFIFHLAAQSFIGPAITNPALTLNTNINITLSLLEAVRAAGVASKSRILNVGSSDQYGFVLPSELPVNEKVQFRPGNPYAVSKIAQEMLGYQYFRSYGIHIVSTRAFNHLGPGLNDQLAAGSFARQLARIEAGLVGPILYVGNLEPRRDYLDVRDVVRGYWLALQTNLPSGPGCQPGEAYNLCSGVDHSIQDILNGLLNLLELKVTIEIDASRLRPSDMPVMRGDYTKFREATGWQPAIPIEQSLRDLLDSWREETRQNLPQI